MGNYLKKTLFVGLPLASASVSVNEVVAKSKEPNIIFIFADDLGYGDIACLNPQSKIETPTLDKIASEGLNFTDAHTNSSVSTPSRYGVVTGRYCWRSSLKKGVLGGYSSSIIERDRATVASMLKQEGYSTYCIGKWHLGMDGWQNRDGSPIKAANSLNNMGLDVDYNAVRLSGASDRGFDYFYGISASLDIPPFLLIENERVIDTPSVLYDKTKGDKSPYGRGGYAVKDREPSFFLEHFTSKVVSIIKSESKKDSPFFIYFPMNAPHAPIAPHADFKGKSGAGAHGDFVMEVDYRVSQLYKALEEAGIADNTLVVFSSDNGAESVAYKRFIDTSHSSSGNLRGVKRDLWEGGHRVPMFVTWPNVIKKGKEVKQTICLLDFYATAADIVGHKLDADEAEDSYSYLPIIKGKGKSERDFTIHHGVSGRFAVRKGDWVLIETKTGHDNSISQPAREYYQKRGYNEVLGEGSGELFNLKNDIEERNNQYLAHPEIVKELTAILDKCRDK